MDSMEPSGSSLSDSVEIHGKGNETIPNMVKRIHQTLSLTGQSMTDSSRMKKSLALL